MSYGGRDDDSEQILHVLEAAASKWTTPEEIFQKSQGASGLTLDRVRHHCESLHRHRMLRREGFQPQSRPTGKRPAPSRVWYRTTTEGMKRAEGIKAGHKGL